NGKMQTSMLSIVQAASVFSTVTFIATGTPTTAGFGVDMMSTFSPHPVTMNPHSQVASPRPTRLPTVASPRQYIFTRARLPDQRQNRQRQQDDTSDAWEDENGYQSTNKHPGSQHPTTRRVLRFTRRSPSRDRHPAARLGTRLRVDPRGS